MCPILGPAGRLGSVRARCGCPARLWSRESQEPGSSYLSAAEKEQVRELPKDERGQPGAGRAPSLFAS